MKCTERNRMNPAQLVKSTNDSSPEARQLNVQFDPALPPSALVASERLAPHFLSIHENTVEVELFDNHATSHRLAIDNPFLTESDRVNLDDSGVIRPGVQVALDTVLASILEVYKPIAGHPSPPTGMQRVTDDSLRTPYGWEGALVRSAQLLPRSELASATPKNVVALVRIVLQAQRHLQPGDLLLIAPRMDILGPITHFADLGDEIDLVVGSEPANALHLQPHQTAPRLIAKAELLAMDVLRVRKTGPYSLISKQPLAGRLSCPGQPFSAASAHWLWSHRLVGILTELTALNCHQATHGTVLAPYSLHVLTSQLRAMGWKVELNSETNHVSLRLSPANERDLVSSSSGEIKKSETFNYRTYKPEPGGLFCESIFGPEESPSRDRSFAHITLPVEIVPHFYRFGSTSILSYFLGIPPADLDALIEYNAYLVPNEGGYKIAEINPADFPDLAHTGAAAVRLLLANLPDDRLPPGLRGRATSLVTRTLLVLPPDLRPLILLRNGNFASADLNDLYRRIINRANRLHKLLELKAPQQIILAECRSMQQAADSLFCNQFEKRTSQVRGSSNRPLVDLSGLITRTFSDTAFKREDFSARARVIVNASVSAQTALIPQSVFATLNLHPDVPLLFSNPQGTGCLLALKPIPHPYPVISLPQSAFEQLGYIASADPQCILFRLLTPAGIADANVLLNRPIKAIPTAQSSRLDSSDPTELLEVLLMHVLSGDPLHFDTARTLLIGGTGSVAVSAIPATARPERRDIPIPLAQSKSNSRIKR